MVSASEDTLIECLGDLGRYRMASQHGRYSMAVTAWQLQHGSHSMVVTAWPLQHGSIVDNVDKVDRSRLALNLRQAADQMQKDAGS